MRTQGELRVEKGGLGGHPSPLMAFPGSEQLQRSGLMDRLKWAGPFIVRPARARTWR